MYKLRLNVIVNYIILIFYTIGFFKVIASHVGFIEGKLLTHWPMGDLNVILKM